MAESAVPLDAFLSTFGTQIELSSVALGGQIIDVSDEFFAEAIHLIQVQPAPSLKGQFGPKGALYSGWESRRHNDSFDWCIIRLGAAGFISGFDIDTSHFNGNEAPEASVEALFDGTEARPTCDDSRWSEILPRVKLGPNSRHLFKTSDSKQGAAFNYVKLNMYPDGGIARFRVYGLVDTTVTNSNEVIDLANVYAGGRVVFVSDQHFGVGSNLLLPGRGKDMGDGWETKRSREKGHKDWVIIKLGVAGILEHAEIDTAHFMGNFPESCELHGIYSDNVIPEVKEDEWSTVLPRTKLGPHRRHFFQLAEMHDKLKAYTHVRVTIHPDGGIKRVRVFGRPAHTTDNISAPFETNGASPRADGAATMLSPTESSSALRSPLGSFADLRPPIPALPLTPEAFAPFGRVVQSYASPYAAPPKTKVTSANQGSATKFHKLALLGSNYPEGSEATTGISTYRCLALEYDAKDAVTMGWEVKLLERHRFTTQAFIPMGGGGGSEDSLQNPGDKYLVIVAKNVGDDNDQPDLNSLRAFIAHAGQTVMYNAAVWHHPMIALQRTMMDFACVETQIGDGSAEDCDIIHLVDDVGKLPRVRIPLL